MSNENTTIAKVSRKQASEQIVALGGIVTETSLSINGHECKVAATTPYNEDTALHACIYDYGIPADYREAVSARQFNSAAEAVEFLEKALDLYDNRNKSLLEGLATL